MNAYVKTAREVLDETPARNPQAVGDYLNRLKRARSDLKSYVGGVRKLGDREYLTAGSLLEDMHERVPMAELLLSAVRDEIVLEDEVDHGSEDEVDLQKTTEALAHRVAIDTVAQPAFSRVVEANAQFDQYILPLVPEGMEDFPRARYNELFADLSKLSSQELATKIATEYPKSFPTNDWIGPPPQGGVDHMPSNADSDSAANANPAPDSSDEVIEDKLDAERKFRGIKKNKETTSSLHMRKGLRVTAKMELVAADDSGVVAIPEGTEGEVIEEHGESSEAEEGLFEVDFEGAQDTVLVPESLIEAKVAVEDKSKVKMMGEGEFSNPLTEDAMEEEFRQEQEKDFRSAEGRAPRGPNRRKNEDVNAWSTPSRMLTSAMDLLGMAEKVASQYENMTRDEALELIATVQAAEEDPQGNPQQNESANTDQEEGQAAEVQVERTDPTPQGAGVGSIPSEGDRPHEGDEQPQHRDVSQEA